MTFQNSDWAEPLDDSTEAKEAAQGVRDNVLSLVSLSISHYKGILAESIVRRSSIPWLMA